MTDSRKDQQDVPWWLQGDQQCIWCLQAYAVEAEFRCSHCDEAVCSDCVVEIRAKELLLCGPCADAYAAESDT